MKKEEIKSLLDKFKAAANTVERVECWSDRELQTLLGNEDKKVLKRNNPDN